MMNYLMDTYKILREDLGMRLTTLLVGKIMNLKLNHHVFEENLGIFIDPIWWQNLEKKQAVACSKILLKI